MSRYGDDQFPFQAKIKQKFKKWTCLEDEEVLESLNDITGDTFFEMRKLISILLCEVERLIQDGEYPGYLRGTTLTEDQRKNLKGQDEDLKRFIKEAIESTWRGILARQSIGVEKMAISLKPHLKEKDE